MGHQACLSERLARPTRHENRLHFEHIAFANDFLSQSGGWLQGLAAGHIGKAVFGFRRQRPVFNRRF